MALLGNLHNVRSLRRRFALQRSVTNAPQVAFSASSADLARVAALLNAGGIEVSPQSLAARLAEDEGGILASSHATLSWTLDTGALHVYDVAGDASQFEALLSGAEAIARARFAAVLVAACYGDEPLLAQLERAGFTQDWSEDDVTGGRLRRLVSLVREVA